MNRQQKLAVVVGLLLVFVAWPCTVYFTIALPKQREREKVYKECMADGKPSYYCQALAREATR